jgi:multidrug resistance efflux pump
VKKRGPGSRPRRRTRRRPWRPRADRRHADHDRAAHVGCSAKWYLSGTLLSPDQAKISSEVAGIIREVRMQLGTEVKAGDVLVRLEPRELQFALDRAESALRQVEAQLGIDRSRDKQPPADEQIASVRQAMANRDDARSAYERAQQLNGRGLLTRADRDTAETRMKVSEANYQAALDNVHSLKQASRIAARRTNWRRRSWPTR